jgi:hypothetical protein
MAYYEGDNFPMGGGNCGGGFADGWWGIILIALLFGWGRGGGFGGGYGNGGSEVLGYELGKVATTNDIASGFNNSAVLSNLNSLKEGQLQMINYNNQGFNGLNTSILTTGNTISREIADCCCGVKSMILENRYLNEKQTCDIITNANANTQKIIDYFQNEKICSLQAENVALKGRISNDAQTAAIVGALAPKQPIPAYPVFPTTSFAYPTGVTFGVNGNCGCNNSCYSVQ